MLSDEDCFLPRDMTTKAKEMIMRKCIWIRRMPGEMVSQPLHPDTSLSCGITTKTNDTIVMKSNLDPTCGSRVGASASASSHWRPAARLMKFSQ